MQYVSWNGKFYQVDGLGGWTQEDTMSVKVGDQVNVDDLLGTWEVLEVYKRGFAVTAVNGSISELIRFVTPERIKGVITPEPPKAVPGRMYQHFTCQNIRGDVCSRYVGLEDGLLYDVGGHTSIAFNPTIHKPL